MKGGINIMAKTKGVVHHGGPVGKAAKQLASKNTSKKTKSKAGKILENHKEKMH